MSIASFYSVSFFSNSRVFFFILEVPFPPFLNYIFLIMREHNICLLNYWLNLHIVGFVYFIVVETGSHIGQAGFELTIELRMTLSAGITSTCHCVWISFAT